MTRLVLGSASTGRLKVLRQAGVDPLVVVSGVDEDAVMAGLGSDVAPDAMVAALASAKADAVTRQLPAEVSADCVVVGCDSMLLLDGQLRGKPDTVAIAREQWQSMAGRSGQLHTGHCLIRLQGRAITDRQCETVVTTVHFGSPSAADLDAYLDSGEPLQVAGGFTLDGLGGWFIDGVDGDPSSVIGISLPLLRTLLSRVGLSIAKLWAT
ncbi:septum formation inhibitor Maf [Mycobacterium eburneum]|nr:nucleoside triphosphate pyrophosphatase [Mycobacterium eburneum]TDH49405.1 septum formation inhibitor Maf [Mycobacterium eburneum]